MRNLLVFLAVVGLGGCQPAADAPAEPAPAAEEEVSLNAVDVDPDINTVEFENDWVRVIRIKTPPGHKSNRHTHDGGVYVGLTDSKGKSALDDGEVMESEGKAGDIGDTFEMIGVPHVSENVGDTEDEGVLVELKIDSGAPVAPPSHDAVAVDGEHHTVELENDLVRVVRMTYPEGYATPPHNHYPGVNILLSDAKATSAPEGEETEPVENEAGIAAWSDGGGDPHVTRNLGDEMHIVRVELKVQ